MSDTTSTGNEGTGTEGTEPVGGGEPVEAPAADAKPDNKTTFDADYVKGLRSESAGYRTKARDAEAALTEATEKVSSLEAAAPALTKRAEDAETLAVRYEVALDHGLTKDLAKRLVGATREELEADALTLKGQVKTAPADLGQGNQGEPTSPPKDVNAALRALAGK